MIYIRLFKKKMANRKLRSQLANYLFNREWRNHVRKPHTVAFDDAKSIGIIYDATDNDDYELVKNYVKELRDQKKEVLALGFVNQDELPNMRFSKLGLDFFTRKNLNWYFKPSHPMVSKFIDGDFDILIFLNVENMLPLKYVAAATKARFKIGKYDSKNSRYCDFMIKTEEHIPLKQFINLVNQYLKIFRNAQPSKA